MIPGNYDITIYKGGTFDLKMTAKSASDVAMDFSVYDEIRMQIRPTWAKMPYTEAALMDLTAANGRIIVSVDGLSLSLNIDAADTEVITFKDGKYGIELIKYVNLPTIPVEIVDKFFIGLVSVAGEVIA